VTKSCAISFPIAVQFRDRIAADDTGVALKFARGASETASIVLVFHAVAEFTFSLFLSPPLSVTFRKFGLLEKNAGSFRDDVRTASSELCRGEEKLHWLMCNDRIICKCMQYCI